MKSKQEWYCLNCRKSVDANPVGISFIGVTAQVACKECGLPFVIRLKETNSEDFEKLVKKFEEETDKL
jgi:DNA-directed RNA polymerase subunit RPC12/RpoP